MSERRPCYLKPLQMLHDLYLAACGLVRLALFPLPPQFELLVNEILSLRHVQAVLHVDQILLFVYFFLF